ncbi:MAG: hypothetical protein JJE50_01550 [Actinomycetales bacterium]|nr:hypothetical protein [Actinomycetales bacterium]
MSAPDALRLALMEPDAYGAHCAATRTDALGWIAATCTLPAGHDGATHTDIHEGRTWT